MSILSKIGRNIVYHVTEKPSHYVHVDKPKSLQDLRQVQYNNWCKTKGVYNGSYLPKNPDMLSNKRGWIESNGRPDKQVRNFQRKSTGQKVRFDAENEKQYDHYHWENGNSIDSVRKKKACEKYIDRYGNVCREKSPESHLSPLDKDYIYKNKK